MGRYKRVMENRGWLAGTQWPPTPYWYKYVCERGIVG